MPADLQSAPFGHLGNPPRAGATLACSRPEREIEIPVTPGDRGARDAGWVGPAQVVDIRATRTAPKVYVAVGIRGDTFHNAAIEEADFVLAIHPDPDAPIFEVADLCLEADPAEVLPALLRALQN